MRLSRIVLTLLLGFSVTPAFAADLWRPKGAPSFVNSAGRPYASAKLCFYDSGTTDQKTVYKDSSQATPWSQPITLNSAGQLSDPIFVPTGAFKEKFLTSDATTCDNGTTIYTADAIPGALDVGALGIDFAKPETPALAKASNYTITTADLGHVVNVDATGAGVTLTLPAASAAGDGGQITARKTDNGVNTVTLATVGGETINGSSTLVLTYQYDSVTIASNGSGWTVIAKAASAWHAEDIASSAVTFAKINSAVYDTDGTLTANSDSKLPTQKAVKTYVDTVTVSGVKWKDPVRVATTTNGTLATAFDDSSTVDGVVLATGNRILIKNQSDQTVNGIYVVEVSGAPTRSTDADANGEIPGATVFVEEGDANAATQWTNTNTTVTLASTNITFSLIAAGTLYTAGTCLDLIGSAFSVEDGCIGTAQISTDGVGSDEIVAGAVGDSELGSGAVSAGKLSTAVEAKLRDVGEVITFSGATCPAQSLEANGAAISRSTYSAYFSVVSTLYGVGNGTTTFNLPNYSGYFLRGWDHAAGADPDAASRTNAGGGTTGNNVGTKQADAIEGHTHFIGNGDTENSTDLAATNRLARRKTTGDGVAYDLKGTSSAADIGLTSSSGGNETRPQNINVLYCVFVGA